MEKQIIKKNTFWDIFIATMFLEKPEYTCTLRRKLIFLIPVMIITLPIVLTFGIIILFSKDKYRFETARNFDNTPPWAYLILFQIVSLICLAVSCNFKGLEIFVNHHLTIGYFLSPLFGILGLSILAGIIITIIFLQEKCEELKNIKKWAKAEESMREPEIKSPSLISVLYKSLKEKFCKQIEYEE